jgi:hypothetical protein
MPKIDSQNGGGKTQTKADVPVEQPGFLESALRAALGGGQAPTMDEAIGGPAYTAGKGLYQEGKRVIGEGRNAYKAYQEGNTPGAEASAIKAIPFFGGAVGHGADMLPTNYNGNYSISDVLSNPGILGHIVGSSAAMAPMALGARELFGMGGKVAPTPKAMPTETPNYTYTNPEAARRFVRPEPGISSNPGKARIPGLEEIPFANVKSLSPEDLRSFQNNFGSGGGVYVRGGLGSDHPESDPGYKAPPRVDQIRRGEAKNFKNEDE